MKLFHAQILTPDGPVFDGQVQSIRMPGTEGDFQVLVNHASLMATLSIGEVTLIDATGKEQHFAVSGGIADVNNNQVSLFVEAAEKRDQISIERALASKERAEKRMKDTTMDRVRAEAAFYRAVNRLKVARS